MADGLLSCFRSGCRGYKSKRGLHLDIRRDGRLRRYGCCYWHLEILLELIGIRCRFRYLPYIVIAVCPGWAGRYRHHRLPIKWILLLSALWLCGGHSEGGRDALKLRKSTPLKVTTENPSEMSVRFNVEMFVYNIT